MRRLLNQLATFAKRFANSSAKSRVGYFSPRKLQQKCVKKYFHVAVKDRFPPSRIVDLQGRVETNQKLLNLRWSAPGDDLDIGRGMWEKRSKVCWLFGLVVWLEETVYACDNSLSLWHYLTKGTWCETQKDIVWTHKWFHSIQVVFIFLFFSFCRLPKFFGKAKTRRTKLYRNTVL